MLRIRFKRTGKKNQPFFRLVVTERKNPPKGGRPAQELGFYNPLSKESRVDEPRVKFWIEKGAKPSDSVYNFLISKNILTGPKRQVHAKAKTQVQEKGPEPSPETVPAPSAEKSKENVPSTTDTNGKS